MINYTVKFSSTSLVLDLLFMDQPVLYKSCYSYLGYITYKEHSAWDLI